jgi:hypothetical protein
MTLTSTTPCAGTSGAWPTTRVLFALAGTITLLSAALAAAVSPWFLLLTTFAGFNQLLYVAFGACPASLIIERLRSTDPTAAPGMLNARHHKEN